MYIITSLLWILSTRSRRKTGQDKSKVTKKTLVVGQKRHHVQLNAQDIKLTPTEYKLLVCFLHNQDKVLTQQMLLRHIWGNEEAAQANYLHVYVAHLRRKLEPDASSPRFFHTISGVGYRFQSTLEATIT